MSIDRSAAAWAAVLCMAAVPAARAATQASAAHVLDTGGTPQSASQTTDGLSPARAGTLHTLDSGGQQLSWALSAFSGQSGLDFSVDSRVQLSAASTAGGLASSGGASARLSFVDTFVIDCAGCVAGTTGTLQLSVPDLAAVMAAGGAGGRDSGSLSLAVAAGGFGAAQLAASTTRTIELSVQGDNLPLPPGTGPADSSAWWTRTETETWRDSGSGGSAFLPVSESATDGEIRFVFGQPIRLVLSMAVSAGLELDAWLSAGEASFEAGLWREAALRFELPRVLAVFDASGAALAGYSALSASGLDLAAVSAVPEPSPAQAWMAGLLLLGALGWRRRRLAQQVLTDRFETLSDTYRTGYAELTSKA